MLTIKVSKLKDQLLRQPDIKGFIMEIVYFTAVAILLYLGADRAVDLIERRRGARLENRSIIFFVILVASSLIVFRLIRILTGAG